MKKCNNCGTEQEGIVCIACGHQFDDYSQTFDTQTIPTIPSWRISLIATVVVPIILQLLIQPLFPGNMMIGGPLIIYWIYAFLTIGSKWEKKAGIEADYFRYSQEIELSKPFWDKITSGTLFIDNAALLCLFDSSYYATCGDLRKPDDPDDWTLFSFDAPCGKLMHVASEHLQAILLWRIKTNHGKIIISDKQINFLENQKYAGSGTTQQAAKDALSWISGNRDICCVEATENGEMKNPSEQFLDFLLNKYKNYDNCFLIMTDNFYYKDGKKKDELSFKLDLCSEFQNAVCSKQILPVNLFELAENAIGRAYFIEFTRYSCKKPGWLPPTPKLFLEEFPYRR